MLAIHIIGVAVAWHVYSLTKDPLSLGLVGLSSVLPTFLLALWAGNITDKSIKKDLLLWGQLGTFLGIAGLLVISILAPKMAVASQVNSIYFFVFIMGSARAFVAPAQFSLFSEVVPDDERVEGVAWNSSVWQLAAALGPALGGLLYGFSGAVSTYAFALFSLVISIFWVFKIKSRNSPIVSTKENPKDSLFLGLRFIFKEKIVLSTLALDMFAVLFGGAVALLPFFADKLGVGPEGLGLLRAAPFAGATLMAIFVAGHPPRKNSGRYLLWAVAGYGLCIIGFGLSKNFYLSFGILVISGALDQISVVVRGAILQLMTPDTMRGRVSAVNQVFIASSNELGEMESGIAAKLMGTVPSVLFGGTMTLLIVLYMAIFSPHIRNLNLSDLEHKKE